MKEIKITMLFEIGILELLNEINNKIPGCDLLPIKRKAEDLINNRRLELSRKHTNKNEILECFSPVFIEYSDEANKYKLFKL